MSTIKCDVLIVGAGVFGMSTAYYIKKENHALNVVVIDKEAGAGRGTTSKSAAAYRIYFTSTINRKLAASSVNFYEHLQHEKKIDLGLHQTGYLWLLNEEKYKRLAHAISLMKKENLPLEIWDRETTQKNVPNLVTDFTHDEDRELLNLVPVDYSILTKRAGWLDPHSLVSFYEQEFKKMGGKVYYGKKVKKVLLEAEPSIGLPKEPHIWQKAKISGVETTDGTRFDANTLILATGPWTNFLLDPLGIDSHTKPKKRQLFQLKSQKFSIFKAPPAFSPNPLPFTILPYSGVYFRYNPNEETVWIGAADNIGRPFNDPEKSIDDPQPEMDFYEYGIYYVLSKYFPIFENIRVDTAWAGYYTYNTIDKNPYVFRADGLNLIICTGGSGSGIMKADSIGRITAALYYEQKEAKLFGDVPFNVDDLSVKNRRVEHEEMVI